MNIIVELFKDLNININTTLFVENEKTHMKIIFDMAKACPNLTFEEIYAKLYDLPRGNWIEGRRIGHF